MKSLKFFTLITLIPFTLTGCKATGGGGGSNSAILKTAEQPVSVVDSTIQVTQALLDEISGTTSLAKNSKAFRNSIDWFFIPNTATAQSTCTRAIANPTTPCAVDATTQIAELKKTYNNCSIGSARLAGDIKLRCQISLDGAPTCDCFSSNGGMVNTPPNGRLITWTGSLTLSRGNDQFSLSSETHLNYLGQDIGGGIRVQTLTGLTSNLTILGIRRMIRSNNNLIYDASIRSDTNEIQVSQGYGPFARAISGGFTLYDRNKQRTYRVQFDNLRRGSLSCCHPTTGSFIITDNLGNRIVAQFNGVDFSNRGCGDITLTENNFSPKKYTLTSCY
jgi:hypothetical protein